MPEYNENIASWQNNRLMTLVNFGFSYWIFNTCNKSSLSGYLYVIYFVAYNVAMATLNIENVKVLE